MQKYEIEIGSVTELESAQLAIANNRKSGLVQFRRVAMCRSTVLDHELLPAHIQRQLQHELSRIGLSVADLHERQSAESIGNRNTKHGGSLKLAHRVERRLNIVSAKVADVSTQTVNQFLAGWRFVEQPCIEKLVEQQGMLGHLLRKHGALAREAQQSLECLWVLRQQRQVSATPTDSSQHGQQPCQRDARVLLRFEQRDHADDDVGKALATDLVHATVEAAVSELGQQSDSFGILRKPCAAQGIGQSTGLPGSPDGVQIFVLRRCAVRVPRHAIELGFNVTTVPTELCG